MLTRPPTPLRQADEVIERVRDFGCWHVYDMPTGSEDVRFRGRTGSNQTTVEMTRLTRSGLGSRLWLEYPLAPCSQRTPRTTQPEEPRWAGSRICATALMANNPVSTFGLISDENRCAEAELSRGRPTQPGAAQQYSVRASRAVAGDGECAACISLRARRELDGDLSLRVVQKRDRETVPGKSACTLRCLDLHGTARRVRMNSVSAWTSPTGTRPKFKVVALNMSWLVGGGGGGRVVSSSDRSNCVASFR